MNKTEPTPSPTCAERDECYGISRRRSLGTGAAVAWTRTPTFSPSATPTSTPTPTATATPTFTLTATSTPSPRQSADINGDGVVDHLDQLLLMQFWLQTTR